MHVHTIMPRIGGYYTQESDIDPKHGANAFAFVHA